MKGVLPDAGDAGRNRDIGQAATIIKQVALDRVDACRNSDPGQVAAKTKRILPEIRDAISDGGGGEGAAEHKHRVFDVEDAGRNINTGDVCVFIKSRRTDGGDGQSVDIRWNGDSAARPSVSGDGECIVGICRVSELGLRHDRG